MKEKIDSAITIAILTAFSYGIAYLYQFNYKGYYNLPAMFKTELNINTMTPPLFIAFIIFTIIFGVWTYLKITFLVLSEDSKKKFLQSNFFLEGLVSLQDLQDLKIYSNKTKNLWFVLYFLIFISLFAFGTIKLGEYNASERKDYMVIKQKEHLFVAITSYQDSLILAPLDLEKESMTPKFKTIEIKELKDAEMIRFENGLKVEDVKNSKDLIE